MDRRDQTQRRAAVTDPALVGPNTVRLVNLTPHEVHVHGIDGTLRLPVTPSVTRLPVERDPVGVVEVGGVRIPLTVSILNGTPQLPEPEPGVLLVVSRAVAEALPERSDLVFPDQLIRDENGVVTGCRALGRMR